MAYNFNKYQTALPDEFLNSLKQTIKSDLIEYIEQIPFLRNMSNPNRIYAKDAPRDDSGKIIVNITNPHILEDMDYFRQAAIYFQQHSTYTHLYPNKAPNSEYVKFWKEEARRCREGLIREDGEWITGYYYFYLNYATIPQNIEREGSKRADRVTDFPKVYDGDYLYTHYMEQARNDGKHCIILKKRGAGYSLKAASHLGRNFIHGESESAYKNIKSYAIANEKEYLTKDGILNKFIDIVDFVAQNTPFPSHRGLKDSMNDMHWTLGYKDPESTSEKGVKNEVIGVTLKNDHEKARGKRGSLIVWEEAGKFSSFLSAWQIARPSVEEDNYAYGIMVAFGTGGCLTAGNKVFTSTGNIKNIEDVKIKDLILGFDLKTKQISKENVSFYQPETYKECIKLTTNFGRSLECSYDHPIYASNKVDYNEVRIFDWIDSGNLKSGDLVAIAESIDIFSNNQMWEPRLVGLLIGDGTYGEKQSPRLANCDKGILDYVENKFNTTLYQTYQTKKNDTYKVLHIKGIRDNLRDIGIYGQTKLNKRLPKEIFASDKNSVCELLAGLFDTDGHISIRKNKRRNSWIGSITLTSSCKELLSETQLLLQKLGIHGGIKYCKPNLNKTIGIKDVDGWYNLNISDRDSLIKFANSITLFAEHKQENLNIIKEVFDDIKPLRVNRGFRYEKIKIIEKTGIKQVYNLTADTTNTYLGNGIITHNTYGSDFEGLQEIFYNPSGYNVLGLPNVYDKNAGEGSSCSFFVPTYLNTKGYYDHNGNSDVIGALLAKIKVKDHTRYNTADPNAVIQEMAENPITPQDAIMRVEGNRFPSAELREHLSNIMPNKESFVSSHYIGLPIVKADGTIEIDMMSGKTPVREFPLKDNKNKEGCLEIFNLPIRRADGTIPYGRYLAGMDPYDDDESGTNSLGSLFILDSVTDRIVAEYTGRPLTAKDYYSNCHKTLQYYNALCNYENDKKGFFAYMENNHGLHYLCENPQILKGMDMIKPNYLGNKAKGTGSGVRINSFGRSLYADWLRELAYGCDVNEEGVEIKVPNLYKIRSIGLIQETIAWNPEGNFDRLSALGMLMILREDRAKLEVSLIAGQKTIANDKFFDKHFTRFNKSAIGQLNKIKLNTTD